MKLSTEADRGMVRRDTAGDAGPEPSPAPGVTSPCAVAVLVHASATRAGPGRDQEAVQSRHWLWKHLLRLPWAFPRTGSRTTSPEGDAPGCGCIYANGVLPCGHCASARRPQHMCGPLGEALPGLVLLCSFLHSRVGRVKRGKN